MGLPFYCRLLLAVRVYMRSTSLDTKNVLDL